MVSATVRVKLVVEVTVGNWGADATFLNLRDQATREAKQQLQSVINKNSSSIKIISAESMYVTLEGEIK
jgi:hypothetical protein